MTFASSSSIDMPTSIGYSTYACPVTENAYDPAFFGGRVSRYPFPDHHAPPLALLALAVREMQAWLLGDPDRVIVVHCKAGKGRSGTIACAYLLTLEAPPTGPKLQKSMTAKEWAVRRAEELLRLAEEDLEELEDWEAQTEGNGSPTTARRALIPNRRKTIKNQAISRDQPIDHGRLFPEIQQVAISHTRFASIRHVPAPSMVNTRCATASRHPQIHHDPPKIHLNRVSNRSLSPIPVAKIKERGVGMSLQAEKGLRRNYEAGVLASELKNGEWDKKKMIREFGRLERSAVVEEGGILTLVPG
ncbi:hypothetical protein DACRYDRAFT_118087 [Dacryopinax primogenitus]|uniref:phosphatidylinositol-3,4,5-trisphosphate 3-phosphatase n=1 Tax=Dacryopinax primogenitus (strain DJM 731) TaxID=1858805 RepID=M5FQU7_DACPD|nr:uncharacterized protein DACRYDRAFT_118087 [Dacryopinax primogenitus]EJT99350.1 hypothetical protein DACRYDRAFT_118087 [Dacryopinax primogenitus]